MYEWRLHIYFQVQQTTCINFFFTDYNASKNEKKNNTHKQMDFKQDALNCLKTYGSY